MFIDASHYKKGKATKVSDTLKEAYANLHSKSSDITYIRISNPAKKEIEALAKEFNFHDLLLEDIIQAHQRPKLERYDDILFAVVHPAYYSDKEEEVEFSELHIIMGKNYIITLKHGEAPNLNKVLTRIDSNAELLQFGAEAVLYAIIDNVVDEYSPIVRGLDLDIEQSESQVFRGNVKVSERIYKLSGEVTDFQRAVNPLRKILSELNNGFAKYNVDEELQAYWSDVEDHIIRIAEEIISFRSSLKDLLSLDSTLATKRHMEAIRNLTEVSADESNATKKISSWAAIIFVPSLIGSIYGMNFENMPELEWEFGYPFSLALMLVAAIVLYIIFKIKKWL